ALDGLVDALAIQDPALQLLDADAEKLLVLPLDLAPPGLVLGKLFLGLVDYLLFVVERAVCLRLRPGALVALARACHASLNLLNGCRGAFPPPLPPPPPNPPP